MGKDEIINLARNLMEETLYARAYKDILEQFAVNRNKYEREINLSPAFYGMSEMAFIEALSMRLARLYDCDVKSAGLGYLMKVVKENIDVFPKDRGECVLEQDGMEYRFTMPLKHVPRECERYYFRDKLEEKESYARLFSSHQEEHIKGIAVEVTIEELMDMYHNRFASLQSISKNLINQRNKIYAHNDKNTDFDYASVYQRSPLSHKDVDNLIEFAEDYTAFCYEYLSGNYAYLHFKNIDDWENTLVYAEKGIDWTCREWKEKYGEKYCPFPQKKNDEGMNND